MDHRDIMPFHKIKYKHIAYLLLISATIVSYHYTDFTDKNITFAGVTFIICIIVVFALTIQIFLDNWNKTIL